MNKIPIMIFNHLPPKNFETSKISKLGNLFNSWQIRKTIPKAIVLIKIILIILLEEVVAIKFLGKFKMM